MLFMLLGVFAVFVSGSPTGVIVLAIFAWIAYALVRG
jgi:hypothetical protein